MVDIAHVIRSRVVAIQFPYSALNVIRQTTTVDEITRYAFQCYGEGAPADVTLEISQAANLAELVVYGQPLPAPSFPEIQGALFFYGSPWSNVTNTMPNSLNRIDVRNFFIANSIVDISDAVFDSIYVGHGPISPPLGPSSIGFTTFFFSDDPKFTGIIPP